jgi:hypothetical protein
MLWAGDGERDGVTDVERLPNYDVYICLGSPIPQLDRNRSKLSEKQMICLIDVFDRDQMAHFNHVFQNRFVHIDADYMGNTPTLPPQSYSYLLAPGGHAYNTEGINGLIMPEENLLNTLELFVPVLPYVFKQRRIWSGGIIELAKRDGLGPGEVWSSPDLREQTYYSNIVANHERFIGWQKQRNPAWPFYADSLEKQWGSLNNDVLCWKLNRPEDKSYYNFQISMAELSAAIEPHLSVLSDYLSLKIERLFQKTGCDNSDYLVELATKTDPYEAISFRQEVMKWLLSVVPLGLTLKIGYYTDARRKSMLKDFGLYYVKVSTS